MKLPDNLKSVIGKTLDQLSDLEFDLVSEAMYESDETMNQFIESNAEDMELTLHERGIHHDYHCDYEIQYIEFRDTEYMEFFLKSLNKGVKHD